MNPWTASGKVILTLGNAVVDIYAHVDDALIAHWGFEKGSMQWVDSIQSRQLLGFIEPVYSGAGGSGANTMFGYSQLGGNARFFGLIAQDSEGLLFQKKF
jgi:sugar/nucleoside kinase (ribokinase family)